MAASLYGSPAYSIALDGASTGSGNTVFGGADGISAGGGAQVSGNVVYDMSGSGITYGGGAPAAISGNTLYGDATGILGGETSNGGTTAIDGNLIYDTTSAGILLNNGVNQSIVNNTIVEPAGTGIAITGSATSTTIENNIFEVTAGPAISVALAAESGFASDYNLFDLNGSAAAIGIWEGISFTSLASWYFELGLDQHSQLGDPDFVSPAGADGISGFGPPTGATQIIDNSAASGFTTTGSWTALSTGVGGSALETAAGSGATATWSFTGLTAGQTYEIGATWPESGGTTPGNAHYSVTNGSGAVLTANVLNQYQITPAGITAGGTGYAVVGVFTATGTAASVTLTGDAGSAVIADATVLVPLGTNGGADDDFHVRTGSPAIDAGDPTTPFLQEPSPNGGRVNLGYDGDTVSARLSPAAASIQVLSPSGLAKYAIGEQVPIDFQTTGLTAEQPVLLLHAGGASIATVLDGEWSADAFRNSGSSISDNLTATQIGSLTGIPTALFSTAADLASATAGQALDFQLPVANGSYTLTLYFADPAATAAGQRVFNIVANGVTLQANYDIFAAAAAQYGDGAHAVSLSFSVTVAGGQGLALGFVNAAGAAYGALVNGIALEQANPGGTARPAANVQVSTDGGATWTTVASGVPVNGYGQGQYVWTANQTSNGDTALIRVLAGAVSGTSRLFLLANGGDNFYVNDASLAGDQYTTAPGNDANSGKSPDQPVASLAALLRAYPIGPGDTIFVDAGSYDSPTNIVLPAGDSGTAAQPVLITGPTIGSLAQLNRGNASAGTDVFDLIGVDDVIIQDLSFGGAYDGVDIVDAASGITLRNDTIANDSNRGINVPDGAGVSNLVVSNSTISNSGSLVYPYDDGFVFDDTGYGIYFGTGDSGALFANDQVHGTLGTGLALNGGNQTVQGGGYHDNNGEGIASDAALIEDVTVYGNDDSGGYGIAMAGGTVSGSTVFSNLTGGIEATASVLVSGNLVYDQITGGGDGIDLESYATGTGNTTWGDVNGIWAGIGSAAEDNLSYANSGAGIDYTSNAPAAISGNTVYGDAIGISGSLYYDQSPVPITGNLIYQNATAGIALTGGGNQSIVNNTIDELVGSGISLSGGATATTIENNILAVAAGPALAVAPSAEIGLDSDYNFFDVTGTGAIAGWEGASYTSLAAWYYATGLDQNSQTGDPDFVAPAGVDGVLGFAAQTGTPRVITPASASGFSTTGTWTAYTGGSGGAGTTALQTATGSGGAANWTFSGLTPGVVYQVAVNWPSNGIAGTSVYTVRDANGLTLLDGEINQYNNASSGLSNGGAGYAVIGEIAATTGTMTVTLSGGWGNVAIADGVLVQALGSNRGADDDFHVQPGSPTIDMGDPAAAFTLEPAPNGGRVNQGYDGDTAVARTSGASQTLQVLNPAQFGKYEVGEQVPITIASDDLGQSHAVLTLAAGGAAIATATEGNWQAGAYQAANGDILPASPQTSGTAFSNTATVTGLSGIPNALFTTGAEASNANPGTALTFDLPAANGGYTLRLYFADPNSTAAGEDVFNIVVNGKTMVANYDVFKAAGGQNIGVELDLSVTAAGGSGIALSLVNAAGVYGAFVNGIELDKIVSGGAVAPAVTIAVSTDGGDTWSPVATDVPVNRFGQAEYVWTVDRTTNGATALIQVTSGALTATSQPFLLANGGSNFYLNDSSLTGDQYTTSVGNDANSGKSPGQPMASLAALLRAYPIGPGDTIYVDTGNYVATSDAVLPLGDGGTAADPALIVGPANGGTVVINRDNPSPGIGVIDETGANDVTIENLTLTGAYDGVALTGVSSGVALRNDTISGNAGGGIFTANSGAITNLTIANSTIDDNIGPGVTLQDGVLSATLSNDQLYDNSGDGIDAVSYLGGETISGGAVYDNAGAGITADSAAVVENAQVHGNAADGIDARGGTKAIVSGNTVYANADVGISSEVGTVTGNTVFDQVAADFSAIEVVDGVTASYNTVYGSSSGLTALNGGQFLDNLIYGSGGDGISLNAGYTYVVTGNILYGDNVGIDGGGDNTTIENNLVYNNVSAGIAITGGTTLSIINNTVYQPVGQALTLSGVSGATVENNILDVAEGAAIAIAPTAEDGLVSDYNLFDLSGTAAVIGTYEGVSFTTLAAWYSEAGLDQHSKTGNPDFVNMAGADGILGGPGTPVGAGADDDFELQAGSPAIDAGNAYVAPFTDLLGQPRHDDPATANTGIGFPLYTQTDGGAVPEPSGGSELSVPANGGVTTYTLPFAFSLYGTSYATVTVSSQGYLQFAGPDSNGGDTPGMADFLNNVRIAPFWGEIDTAAASGDGVFVSTTSGSITFRWQASADSNGGAVNFSVTLNSNGDFDFNYGAGNAGLDPIIGVSAGNGQVYVLSTASGAASLNNADARVWTPQAGDTYFDIGAFEFQGNSADTTPPTVISVTPLPANNGSTGLAFTSLTVRFSEPLDLVSASSPANYSLIEADSNGQFDTTGATPIPVTPVYTLGSSTVTLQLPNGALASGLYQLTLSGTRAIFDQSGNALAGNGTTAGTNYVTDFTIDRSADVAPVAIAQSATVAEGGAVPIVLAATDTQGNPLLYSIETPAADGALSAIVNGNTVTYTPAAGYYGTDSFSFQATDPDGLSNQAAVSLTVTPVNQPPVAVARSLSVIHDAPRVIVLSGTDAETPASQLLYTITVPPAHGTLVANPGSPNAFTYAPAAGYLGADGFSFTVTDTGNPPGNLANAKTSAAAVVSLSVVDPAPVGVADVYTTREAVPLNVPAARGVLANDTDSAGDALTATLASGPAHGVLVLNADGSFRYTPAAGFSGTDSFTYVPHGTDAAGLATTVTLQVGLGGAAAPPPAAPPPSPAGGDLAPPAAGLPVASGGGGAGVIGGDATGTQAAEAVAPAPPAATTVAPATTAPEAAAVTPSPASVSRQPMTATTMAGQSAVAAVAAVAPGNGAPAGFPSAGPAAITTALPLGSAFAAVAPPAFASPGSDRMGLIASLAPLMLPSFTLPGDETSMLALPVTPEISRLPTAFATAAQRVAERTPPIVTFVDPFTGQTEDDDAPAAARDQAWLLVDPTNDDLTRLDGDIGAVPSPIRWDSHPP